MYENELYMPQKITTHESFQLIKPPHKWQLRKRKLKEESNYGGQREQTKEGNSATRQGLSSFLK